MCVYIYIYICIYHTHTYRERGRYTHTYIYIYIYTYYIHTLHMVMASAARRVDKKTQARAHVDICAHASTHARTQHADTASDRRRQTEQSGCSRSPSSRSVSCGFSGLASRMETPCAHACPCGRGASRLADE